MARKKDKKKAKKGDEPNGEEEFTNPLAVPAEPEPEPEPEPELEPADGSNIPPFDSEAGDQRAGTPSKPSKGALSARSPGHTKPTALDRNPEWDADQEHATWDAHQDAADDSAMHRTGRGDEDEAPADPEWKTRRIAKLRRKVRVQHHLELDEVRSLRIPPTSTAESGRGSS